jgi:predicted transcriptional regulator
MYIKKSNIHIIKKSSIMKRELTIDMRVVKNHGANAAIVLAVVNNAYGAMTITEVAGAVGITYPTAHKCLDLLVREKAIQAVDKSTYCKL